MTAELRVERLRKVFSVGRPAVDDVSFRVEAGEIVVLLGPSGCGKTTTLRCVAGLEHPTSGIIAIGGDHTIALPLLRAAAAQHGPLAVLHFDAHLDTWDTLHGASIWHGSPFRRAAEEGLLDLEHCQHVGIRGGVYDPSELEDDARSWVQRAIDLGDDAETDL